MISFGLVLVFLICNISRILILYDIILCVVVHNTILCMVFEGFYIPHSLTILATKRKQRIVIFLKILFSYIYNTSLRFMIVVFQQFKIVIIFEQIEFYFIIAHFIY